MSTSLLYHGFGIVGYHYVSQRFHGGQVTFRIRQPRERLRCPQCQCDDVWVRGHEERTFRMVPIGAKPAFVTLDVARVWCPVCDCVRQVKLGFADPKKRYSRSFERYALELSRHMTIKDVAQHLQVS
jgi:transposase